MARSFDTVLSFNDMKEFLDEKALKYNTPSFIQADPVSVPHKYERKEDIEIAGFLAAAISWGQRCTILANAAKLMEWMDHSPYEFIVAAGNEEYRPFRNFVHRTFNGDDCIFFLQALKNIYLKHGGPENVFSAGVNQTGNVMDAISYFRAVFFEIPHPGRTMKHIADPSGNASAKRLNMFLRWMVRKDKRGVDFGIWNSISPSLLMCPLDVHTGNVARKLGLLERRQNDRKSVEELTAKLRLFDPEDPVKYDFALFGLGIYEGFAN
jgi:uncharacterized protein (TIGR02757 family)